MKGMIYRSFVRSMMLYGSETWCLRETEMVILRRAERAIVRAMFGVKLMERRRTEDLMEIIFIGIEGNSGSDSKDEWSEMVWACVKEE